MKSISKFLPIITIFLLLSFLYVNCGGGGGDGGAAPTAGSGAQATIGPDGGVVAVTNPADPLYGLKLDIPQGALTNYSDIIIKVAKENIPLPQDITPSGIIVSLTPENLTFNKQISITMPYESVSFPLVVSYNQSTNTYDVLPITEIDEQNMTVTVKTTHFSLLGKISDWIIDELNTNFSVSEDAFNIENTSAYFGNGACWGFSSFSKWYFQNKKNTDGNLRNRYSQDCERNLLVDAQNTLFPEKVIEAGLSICTQFLATPIEARYFVTLGEINTAMLLSGKPQVLIVSPPFSSVLSGADLHAVLVYAISPSPEGWVYHIYDNRDNSRSYQITFNTSTHQFNEYSDFSEYDNFTEFIYIGSASLFLNDMQAIYDKYNTINCTEVPSKPLNLIATVISSSQINLSWDASTDNVGVTGYNIYRGGVYLKSVTSTSTTDTGLSSNTEYCYTVSAYDASNDESEESEQSCATTLTTSTYSLLDTGPAGGIIFYDKGSYSNGWRYLEAAPASTEWTHIEWGDVETLISGADGTAFGTGEQNTADIIAVQGTGSTYAAQLCEGLSYGGYEDWFLPSKDELDLIYENLYLNEVGGFPPEENLNPNHYWSSSQLPSMDNFAWAQIFSSTFNGSQFEDNWDDNSTCVRAVRAF